MVRGVLVAIDDSERSDIDVDVWLLVVDAEGEGDTVD